MNLSDQLKDALPICLSGRWLSIEPTVVATGPRRLRLTLNALHIRPAAASQPGAGRGHHFEGSVEVSFFLFHIG
jgi:hypothetical protein